MKSKLFLTSLTAIAIAMPAMAEDFPSTGLMQENKTYTEAANHDNMGVYEGTVSANAEYDWDIITVDPGQYIPANSTSAATCTAGNFCLGITANQQDRTPHYDATNAQGVTSCSTLDNGAFPNSAAGASSNTQCYRACNIANMGANGTIANIAHAATLTGNDYYGNGADTCEPATCVNGYHTSGGGEIPDFTNIIDHNSTWADWSDDNTMTFQVTRMGGVSAQEGVIGRARCSTQFGEYDYENYTLTTVNELPDSTGQYCWCRMEAYITPEGSVQPVSASWVWDISYDTPEECASYCMSDCIGDLIYSDPSNGDMRPAFFDAVHSTKVFCEANEITINWTGASQEAIEATNAGTATYDGDIRTPQSAIPVTGKTFKGWKFVKPTTPSQGD